MCCCSSCCNATNGAPVDGPMIQEKALHIFSVLYPEGTTQVYLLLVS